MKDTFFTSTPPQTLSETLKTVSSLMVCIGGVSVGAALVLEACAAVIHIFRR